MLARLSRADRLAAGGASTAIVAAFLPWYRFDEAQSRVTTNAFGTGFLGDVLFLGAMALLLLVLIRHDVIALRRPIDEPVAELSLGVAALAAVLLQLLIGVNGSGAFHSVTIGILVALVAAAAMAVGGWQRWQQGAEHSPLRRR